MNSGRGVAVTAVVAAVVALASAGTASADNSNNNSNTNDVTNIGGSSAMTESAGTEATTWPPADLSWPPKGVMSGVDGNVGDRGNSNESSTAAPIVMPSGQPAPTNTETPSTPETPAPIVPVATP